MNIKAIRTYQAITFEKRSETFFSTVLAGNKKLCELKIKPDLMCVEIRSEHDHILVPFTNISAIHLVTEASTAEAAAAEEERKNRSTSMKVQDIKRPR